MTTDNLTLVIPKRVYHKDESEKKFLKNAVIGSFILHVIIFLIKLPEMVHVAPKEKLSSIKMNFITPPENYRKMRKEIQKSIANIPKPEMGVAKVETTAEGPTGDKNSKDLTTQKSKAGSPKKGAFSTPNIAGTGNGTSESKGYQFKGNGLKTLIGNSSTMTIAQGSGGGNNGRGLISGTGLGNKGSNLNGEYRAPAGIGDGSGLGGKDGYGNYDRSTTAKGLANKKGIDTAFVESDTVILGSIEPEVLRKILEEYLPQFKFCYQQELAETSEKLKGIVDLNFRIEGNGKVSKVNIKSANTRFSDKGIGCMSNILKMIEFPKPKGGGLVDVRQPLNFLSESTKI